MGRRIKGKAATELFRSMLPTIYWDIDGGVPLYTRPRGGRFFRVIMAPPGDIRPGFKRDLMITYRAIEEGYGKEVADFLLGRDPFILLNKVQGIDAADEVIVSGYSIGVREYDIVGHKWVFKPMYYGVKLIIDHGLGPFIRVNSPVNPGDLLAPTTYSGELPTSSRWVPVATGKRDVYALGKVVKDGVRVVSVWRLRSRVYYNPLPRSLGDVAEANIEHIRWREREAVEFLRGLRGLGHVLINVSGGKDSTAAAQLAVKAGYRDALFLDTGLEFPETIETIEKIVDRLGLNLIRISAGDTFWRALKVYGPPARDYRWCCKVVKFSFLARELKGRFGRIVSIVGQRRYESTSRALAGRLAPSGTTAFDYLAAPIQDWTSLEVYMYLYYMDLPINPLYEMGYERIGCYLCPTSRLAEIDSVRETHPRLWSRWFRYLRGYAKAHRLPREWIDLGLWRWRFSYPGEIRVLAKRLGVRLRDIMENTVSPIATLSPSPRGEECYTVYLNNIYAIDLSKLGSYLKITGLTGELTEDTLRIKHRNGEAVVYRNGVIEVCGGSIKGVRRILKDIVPMIFMIGRCFGCSLCMYTCPLGAIRPGRIEEERCNSCRKCINVCPSASSFTKYVLKLFDLG